MYAMGSALHRLLEPNTPDRPDPTEGKVATHIRSALSLAETISGYIRTSKPEALASLWRLLEVVRDSAGRGLIPNESLRARLEDQGRILHHGNVLARRSGAGSLPVEASSVWESVSPEASELTSNSLTESHSPSPV